MGEQTNAMRQAIEEGHLDTVKRLLQEEPKLLSAIVRPGENRNYRPITEAATTCQLEILEFLIASGGDVTVDPRPATAESAGVRGQGQVGQTSVRALPEDLYSDQRTVGKDGD